MRGWILSFSIFFLGGVFELVNAQSNTLYIGKDDTKRSVTLIPLSEVKRGSDHSLFYKVGAGFFVLGLAAFILSRRKRKSSAATPKVEIKTVSKAPDPIAVLQSKDQNSLQSPSAEFFVIPKKAAEVKPAEPVVSTEPAPVTTASEEKSKGEFKFSESFLKRMAKLTQSSGDSKD